jgi:hypothetical protein
VFFRGVTDTRIRVQGKAVEVLCGRMRQSMVPPSEADGFQGSWLAGPVRKEDLPELKLHLPEKRIQSLPTPSIGRGVAGVQRWIRHVTAVSGQAGHNATYRVAAN